MPTTFAPRLTEPASFNINHRVRIRITAAGREHLKRTNQLWRLTPEYSTSVDDATGFASWRLWEVMEVFGPAIYHGCTMPFETEIELVPD